MLAIHIMKVDPYELNLRDLLLVLLVLVLVVLWELKAYYVKHRCCYKGPNERHDFFHSEIRVLQSAYRSRIMFWTSRFSFAGVVLLNAYTLYKSTFSYPNFSNRHSYITRSKLQVFSASIGREFRRPNEAHVSTRFQIKIKEIESEAIKGKQPIFFTDLYLRQFRINADWDIRITSIKYWRIENVWIYKYTVVFII